MNEVAAGVEISLYEFLKIAHFSIKIELTKQ